MPTTWESVEVRCPFYRENQQRQLTCEGLWPGSTQTVIKFRGSGQTREHMQRLCMGRYTQCRLYGCIEEKYEDRLEPVYREAGYAGAAGTTAPDRKSSAPTGGMRHEAH